MTSHPTGAARPPPLAGIVALDVVYWLTFTVLTAGAAAPLVWLWLGLAWPLRVGLVIPFVGAFVLLFLLEVAVARRLAPRLQSGTYPFPGSSMARAWMWSLVLQRLVFHPWWGAMIMGTGTLRWLAFRALGGRVALRSMMSSDVMHFDVGMLEVEEGALCGARAITGGHFIEDGVLTLGQVHVGAGAQLQVGAMVGPGCHIGARSRLGPDSVLTRDVVIGEDCSIGIRTMVHNGARIGPRARVGDRCVIGPGSVIGADAVIAAGTVLPKCAVVAAGAAIPAEAHAAVG